MNRIAYRYKHRSQHGSALVEFALIGFLLVLVLLASLEFGRMLLVYTTVANAARAGCRYAITHGSDNAATVAQIKAVVTNFAGAAPLSSANLTVEVTYPDTTTTPGSRVDVKAVYSYDPFTILPLSVPLGTISEGVITY